MKHVQPTCVRNCQQTLAGKRRRTTDKCEVEVCGKEGVPGKNVVNDWERAISARDVGTFSPVKDQRQRHFDNWPTRKGRREYKVSGRSPAREYLEQVKCCHDTDCNESMMKKGFTALKNETWEEYKETFLEKDESLRMGLRQDTRGLRVG